MKPLVEEVRVSVRGRDILLKLKRKTGIKHWNTLCRIAFCVSLQQESIPSKPTVGETGIRMDWRTFSGPHSEEYLSLITLKSLEDGLLEDDDFPLSEQFRAHLERGIVLIRNVSDLQELSGIACGI